MCSWVNEIFAHPVFLQVILAQRRKKCHKCFIQHINTSKKQHSEALCGNIDLFRVKLFRGACDVQILLLPVRYRFSLSKRWQVQGYQNCVQRYVVMNVHRSCTDRVFIYIYITIHNLKCKNVWHIVE